MNVTPVKVFVSYAHQDYVWMKRLGVFLGGMQNDDRMAGTPGLHYVHVWHDQKLTQGNSADDEIQSELDHMDIFVPLVGASFFASSYICNIELPRAQKRHELDGIGVVPILVDKMDMDSKCKFLHKFPPLPQLGKPWSKFKRINDAYQAIDNGLWSAIQEALKRK